MIAKLNVISLYEELAAVTENENLRDVLLDAAKGEVEEITE